MSNNKREFNLIGQGSFSKAYTIIQNGRIIGCLKRTNKEKSKKLHQYGYSLLEIDILKSLNHPNIVKYILHEEDTYNIYLTLQYCNAGSLTDLLKKMGSNFTHNSYLLRKIMYDMISAIEYISSKGIIHRDIKLENIMLHDDNYGRTSKYINYDNVRAILIDFGVSTNKCFGETVVGSNMNMDFQLLESKYRNLDVVYDYRVDLISLGIVFYSLLHHGRFPFQAKSKDPKEMELELQQLRNLGKYKVKSSISAEAADLLQILMQKDRIRIPTIKNLKGHPFFVSDYLTYIDIKNLNHEFIDGENIILDINSYTRLPQLIPKNDNQKIKRQRIGEYDYIIEKSKEEEKLKLEKKQSSSSNNESKNNNSNQGQKIEVQKLQGQQVPVQQVQGQKINRNKEVVTDTKNIIQGIQHLNLDKKNEQENKVQKNQINDLKVEKKNSNPYPTLEDIQGQFLLNRNMDVFKNNHLETEKNQGNNRYVAQSQQITNNFPMNNVLQSQQKFTNNNNNINSMNKCNTFQSYSIGYSQNQQQQQQSLMKPQFQSPQQQQQSLMQPQIPVRKSLNSNEKNQFMQDKFSTPSNSNSQEFNPNLQFSNIDNSLPSSNLNLNSKK